MKKLSFLMSLFSIFVTCEISARSISIATPTGATIYISDSATAAELFRECRNKGFCSHYKKLVLYFDNYEIIENSEASNKALWYFGNHVEYAFIGHYNEQNYNASYYDYETRTISIRAPNGMVTTLKANQTPAYFFRACRSAGNCSSIAPMTLKFGTYEIRENSSAANKCFYEFNTTSTNAYVMHWENYSNLDDTQAAAVLGLTLCGIGFLYFLNQLQ